MTKFTYQELKDAINFSWSKETSYSPDTWTPENPAWGQCVVTALVVQDYLGGNLVARFIKNIGWHYWNKYSDKTEEDWTKGQFKEKITFLPGKIIDRDKNLRNYVLKHKGTRERYEILKRRVEEFLKGKGGKNVK